MKLIKLSIIATLLLMLGCDSTDTFTSRPYICLTFDDQHQSIYTEAYPLMEQFGFTGTAFINTAFIGANNKLTWDQIDILVNNSNWEIGGHTLHHVNLPELTYEEAYEEIYLDWLALVERDLPHNSFALPSGHANLEQFGIIAQYYDNIRTSLNLRHYAPINRQYLGYAPFQTGYNAEIIISRIIEAIENHEALVVIGFHSFDAAENNQITFCEPVYFQEILEFIAEIDLEVITLHQVCELLGN